MPAGGSGKERTDPQERPCDFHMAAGRGRPAHYGRSFVRRIVTLVFAAALGLTMLIPAAGAHPDWLEEGHEDHTGPGSTAPDQHSSNMHLLSNTGPSAPNVTQSDMTYDGKLLYAGNYAGFRIFDVKAPGNPKLISEFACNGAQGDLSVYRGLLFRSVDTPQSSASCDSTNSNASTPGTFEGIQMFDVSDPKNPSVVDFIPTDCGSHTNTLVPAGDIAYLYISSYPLSPSGIGPESNCLDLESGGGHGFISIVKVPVNDPTNWSVSKYFLDPATELSVYDLDAAIGTPPGTLGVHSFTACHDISVNTALGLAAGACLSEAQLWDISDPENPEFLWRFDDPTLVDNRLDLWHSSSFSWDGEVVAFGDESGGGAFARCTDPSDQQGRVWFLDVEDGSFLANYKIPRSEAGVCTAHNFNFIPQKDGMKTLVMGNYTGGTTVVDVNALIDGASEAEAEVGYYRQGSGNNWSSYWHDGAIYASGSGRGIDVFKLSDSARSKAVKLGLNNPQTQTILID